ncbi:MAG: methyltransferase [Bacteroidota bacterium]
MMQKKNKSKKLPPMFVINMTDGLRRFFIGLGQKMFPADFVLMEYATNFWIAKSIGVAAELNIADLLAAGPRPVTELAAETATDEHNLYRLLRALAGQGIFKESKGKVFSNTKLSNALLEEKQSMKYFIQHHLGDNNWEFVGDMRECVRTGVNAIQRKHGLSPFEFLERNPKSNVLFNRAMSNSSEMAAEVMSSSFPFGKYNIIADIGGGAGYLLAHILHKNRNIRGILYDLPHVVTQAGIQMRKFAVADRCLVLEGNFFKNIPGNADLYIVKNILHDWNDEDCIKILKNIYASMPDGAKLLVIDAVLKPDNKPAFGKLLDLQMMIGTNGGKERTREEFETVFNASGFHLARVIGNPTPFSFIEGVRL